MFIPFWTVRPACQRRHADQNGFNPSASLQAKQGAAVINQIVFHIAPAAVELEFTLRFSIRLVLIALENRQDGVQIAIADRLHVFKAGFKIPLIQIIKKQAADAALLSAAERQAIDAAAEQVRAAAAGDDADAIKEAIKNIDTQTQEFAARRMDQSVRIALKGQSVDEV